VCERTHSVDQLWELPGRVSASDSSVVFAALVYVEESNSDADTVTSTITRVTTWRLKASRFISCNTGTVSQTRRFVQRPRMKHNEVVCTHCNTNLTCSKADKSLDRPGRKQATATEDFEFHISYL
jgi:hypothetical protein